MTTTFTQPLSSCCGANMRHRCSNCGEYCDLAQPQQTDNNVGQPGPAISKMETTATVNKSASQGEWEKEFDENFDGEIEFSAVYKSDVKSFIAATVEKERELTDQALDYWVANNLVGFINSYPSANTDSVDGREKIAGHIKQFISQLKKHD